MEKKIENVGRCHMVRLQVQKYKLEFELYAVALGGVDLVLAILWLQTLGTYSASH